MPFIGQNPSVGAYNILDDITIGSNINGPFNLLLNGVAFSPESANHLLVSLNGVIQKPGSSFTVSGDQITFVTSSGTLTTSDSIDFIMALGNVLDVGVPTDGSISTNKIATNSVSMDKLATSGTLPALNGSALTGIGAGVVITNNTTGGAGADELVFDLSMDTSYLFQRFVLEGVYSSSAGHIAITSRRATDNTYFSNTNDYAFSYAAPDPGGGGNRDSGASSGRIKGHNIGDSATGQEPSIYVIDVFNNAKDGYPNHTMFSWNRVGFDNAATPTNETGVVIENPQSTQPGVITKTNQFKMENTSAGETMSYSGFVHYGFKRV